MISHDSHPIEWCSFIDELDDAREHLEDLVRELVETGRCDEADLRVHLGHVFAHLNRAWNSRSLSGEITDELWSAYSAFPADLDPIA